MNRSFAMPPCFQSMVYCTLFILWLLNDMSSTQAFVSFEKNQSLRLVSSRLAGDLSFQADAQSFLEIDAPIEHVREWLQTPTASDLQLLGTLNANQQADGSWICQQPRIDFMGLDLQPYFIHRIQRLPDHSVAVNVIDSKTDVLNSNNPANQVVASIMGRAKFTGKSVIRVLDAGTVSRPSSTDRGQSSSSCRLEVDLTLKLHVPLPVLVPLPPGFNSIGSSIVKRTGRSRTKILLQDITTSYREWAIRQQKDQTS